MFWTLGGPCQTVPTVTIAPARLLGNSWLRLEQAVSQGISIPEIQNTDVQWMLSSEQRPCGLQHQFDVMLGVMAKVRYEVLSFASLTRVQHLWNWFICGS